MKNKVPKLRFKEFEGKWKEKKLDSLMQFKNGINAAKDQYGKGIKFINVLDILSESPIIYDSIKGLVEISEEVFSKNTVTFGDIVFQRSSETREEVGTANVYLDKNNIATFGGFVIRGKKIGEYDPIFMNKLLKTKNARNEITSKCGGSTRYNLSQSTLNEVILNFPSLPEQEKIANFLSSVDIKIEKLVKKKELLEKYKKGMMQKLFSQKLRFKDDNGNDYPEWKEKRLGDVCSLKNGLSFDQNLEKKGFPVTRIETISNRNININKIGYVETEKNIEDYKLQIGDILFSNINSVAHIGKIAYVDKEYNLYHGMNLLNIRFYKEYNSKFLYFMIGNKKYKNYFEKMCNQAVNQASINQTDLKKVKLIIPSLPEQEKIANFLSSIDRKIELVEEELEKNKKFKNGLLQQMFV